MINYECKMASIPGSMKALVKEQESVSYTYKDVPVPRPQGDELLVRVNKVALCGSDIMLYQWGEGLLQRAWLDNSMLYS